MNRFLLLLLLLAWASQSWAQAPATDVMLRTDGNEVVGRVVAITPLQVRYLPPAGADTLHLAATDVFLIRYANGTREVLHSAAPAKTSLSDAQWRALARRDAGRNYTDHGAFWGSLGATLYGGPLLGLVAPAVIAPHAIATHNLRTPHPELLAEPAYNQAYRKEAQHHKRGRAWAGYGVGTLAWVVLMGALASSGP
ncbi:hypothetical protein [Hymenobacter rubidus]|uniref:hypothetical protein n=1 Tax=Hymenobacter rubidus TaxID=1441626 RepID=UPI00191D1118|nr:hypothetical protein [Hymenobacter rubidus]